MRGGVGLQLDAVVVFSSLTRDGPLQPLAAKTRDFGSGSRLGPGDSPSASYTLALDPHGWTPCWGRQPRTCH